MTKLNARHAGGLMIFELFGRLPTIVQIGAGFWVLYALLFLVVRGGRHARRILQGVEYRPLDEID